MHGYKHTLHFLRLTFHGLTHRCAVLREAEEYVYWFEPEMKAIMKSRKTVGQSPSKAVTGLEGVTDFVVTLSHYAPSKPEANCPAKCGLLVSW